jgi:hypothetical protein
LVSLGGCSSGNGQRTADVEPVADTTVAAGPLEVVIPAGAASGGELVVEEGPEPTLVPDGIVALGSTSVVSLADGSLDGSMALSFEAPAELSEDQVPIVMAKETEGDWHWLPTSWEGGGERVTAELTGPGQVFLARFDRTSSVDDAVEEFTSKANNPSKAPDPDCGDEQRALDAGLEVSSESGDAVKWCAGVDTIESNPTTTGYDIDPSTEGVQATVLRVTNNSRMFDEVGYPEDWPAVDGSGHALPGQTLRTRLGLAGTIRDGLASRLLAPGETLALLLPDGGVDLAGTVTADLSAAAWTLSTIDFATSTYTRLVTGVDEELGGQVRAAREALVGALAAGSAWEVATAPEEPTPSGGIVEPVEPEESEATEPEPAPIAGEEQLTELRACLAPVAEVILMSPDAAKQLADEATSCARSSLGTVLQEQYDNGPAEMADRVAADVLSGLPAALESDADPWSEISDALTDPSAGFQVWVGPPPAE